MMSELQEPIILRLPIELIGKIVSNLDCHSLKFLLMACQELRKYAVVIKSADALLDSPVFFDIPGVEVKTIKDPNELLKLRRSCFLIKMIEVWGSSLHTRFVNVNFHKFDCSTFIYHNQDSATFRTVAKEQRRITSQYGPKFAGSQVRWAVSKDLNHSFWGHTRYHLLRIMTKPSYTVTPRVFDNLRSFALTCNNTIIVRNLYMPNIETLSIHFFPSWGFPVVNNLWVPNLLNFSITYTGNMPVIKGIHIMERKAFSGQVACFELCHTGAFDIHAPPIIESQLNNYYNYYCHDTMDLSFTRNFTDIMIVGAHELVFRKMDLSNLARLKWLKTVQYPQTRLSLKELDIIEVNEYCSDFTFHTNVPDTIIPCFMFKKLTKLEVFTTAPNLNLNALLSRTEKFCDITNQWNCLADVSICCYLPPNMVGGDGHVVLHKEDLLAFSNSRLLHTIELDGCYLGEQNKFVALDQGLGLLDRTTAEDAKIRIRFVRPQADIADEVSNVLIIPHLFQEIEKSVDCIEIGQVQGGPGYVGWNALAFWFWDQNQANGFHIGVESTFDETTVNGIRAVEYSINSTHYRMDPSIFGYSHRWMKVSNNRMFID